MSNGMACPWHLTQQNGQGVDHSIVCSFHLHAPCAQETMKDSSVAGSLQRPTGISCLRLSLALSSWHYMNIQDSMGMWMWGSFSFQAWPCGHDMNVQDFLLSISSCHNMPFPLLCTMLFPILLGKGVNVIAHTTCLVHLGSSRCLLS